MREVIVDGGLYLDVANSLGTLMDIAESQFFLLLYNKKNPL